MYLEIQKQSSQKVEEKRNSCPHSETVHTVCPPVVRKRVLGFRFIIGKNSRTHRISQASSRFITKG